LNLTRIQLCNVILALPIMMLTFALSGKTSAQTAHAVHAQASCADMSHLPDVTAATQTETYCRTSFTLRPAPDSEINSEVWLPLATAWNGKLLMEGGGGFVGSINTGGLAYAVHRGYVGASTDTGHAGGTGNFFLSADKTTDFAYRAVHETAVEAKKIIAAYYGHGPLLSYFEGCSTGGRQGLMSAQRYPADFDGIVAGAPAYDPINLPAWRMRLLMTVLRSPLYALSPENLKLLNEAVLNKCDALDGVKDHFIGDPRKCNFDPNVLKCKTASTASCLTPEQLETVNAAYSDLRSPTGEILFPGVPFGGELNWQLSARKTAPGMLDVDTFRYLANQDPAWDWHSFDLQKDVDRALLHGKELQATNPNLASFKSRGGKLLLYHGWSDGGSGGSISAFSTISYYDSVLKYMGPNQDNWLRLFMVPGMGHCGEGTGLNQFEMVSALDSWREQSDAPKSITAIRIDEHGHIDMSRPLCPLPATSCLQG
jgi:feruloyl esterase